MREVSAVFEGQLIAKEHQKDSEAGQHEVHGYRIRIPERILED